MNEGLHKMLAIRSIHDILWVTVVFNIVDLWRA